ncbi:hypothetical protein [Sphingobacterium paludis]|uniref:Uncharacterized protein n=1 Tax=Sphingobacterium paludis TaxID=1476465 RepID=A0A4R7DBK7_9SPHI|nr:hypothetical protein [Sphingobacterium paludis]TDS17545.1 hypothetical protein B0I21_101412 [Sphingobacterium paludis]
MQSKINTVNHQEKEMNMVENHLPVKTKLKYTPPLVQVDVIEMEGGIAATSGARIQIGSGQDEFTPEVQDWQVTESEQQLFL